MEITLEKIKNSQILSLTEFEQIQIKGGSNSGDKRTPRPGGGTTSIVKKHKDSSEIHTVEVEDEISPIALFNV